MIRNYKNRSLFYYQNMKINLVEKKPNVLSNLKNKM